MTASQLTTRARDGGGRTCYDRERFLDQFSMSSRLLLSLSLAAATVAAACSSRAPEPSPQVYGEAVTAFYVGLSAMQTTQEVLARQKFDRVVALVPTEPAGWADLGLLLLRQQEIDQGAQHLARAAALAPESPAIQRLQALAESRRGNLNEAIGHWRRALELDPQDQEAGYALALETERQGGPANDTEAQRLLEQLLSRRENLAARLEYVRVAAKRGDQAAFSRAMAPLTTLSAAWSPEAREQLTALTAAAADNPKAGATRVAFLKNVLLRDAGYRQALAEVSTPRAEVGQPVMHFLRLKNPSPGPAPADTALTFTTDSPGGAPSASWIGAVSLDGTGNPVVSTAAATAIRVSGTAGEIGCRPAKPGADSGTPGLRPGAVAFADLHYGFLMDVALAGPSGLCLMRQEPAGHFTDVTAASKLPATLLRTPLYGVWPADIDTDGDLDLVVAPVEGPPIVLRNNNDGTFTPRALFDGVTRARGFVWADLDGEGVPDAAFVDAAGIVQVFINLRGGSFRLERLPQEYGRAVALAVGDQDADSVFDVLVLSDAGVVTRVSRSSRDGTWRETLVSRVDPPAGLQPGVARLLTADLDNNGATDLLVTAPSATRVLLGSAGGSYQALPAGLPFGVQAVADLDGDGRLDLLGLDQAGRAVRAIVHGTKSYRWQAFRPRAATATGDQRINSFGIGGEIELRSGLHVQKQVITSPIVHFGLGEAARAEVVRITWPNGVLQAEFDTPADQTIRANQRLKGSCPWLFAWNGREMAFVTDLLWRSPLGLRINAQATADTLMTEDWVKVRGDQLAARDGAYDLRITAELWETHFFDLVSLLVVDHPADTQVFVDERFAVPPPTLQVTATGPVQSFASVKDDRGGDPHLAAAADSRFVDFAGRGRT